MSTYEASYKPQLQGVSQQIPEERLPGQLTAQTNMLSDPVTGLRRRPGLQYKQAWTWSGVDDDTVTGWFTDVAGQRVHVLVNSATGNIRVLGEDFVEVANLNGGAYLTAADRGRIRAATVGNELFLCNLEKIPSYTISDAGNPKEYSGFIHITAGAFGMQFKVTVTYDTGSKTATYTTPDGTTAGDAALSTPDYIAQQLRDGLVDIAKWNLFLGGPVIYVQGSREITITTSNGKSNVVTSNRAYVSDIGDLPPTMPALGGHYWICRVGSETSGSYFRWYATEGLWRESGIFQSPYTITNAPISLYWNGSAWALNTSTFKGRFAGNDYTNPSHEWMTYGITGMSSFQGRLVLMSGPMVSMSSAANPRAFYRETVTELLPSDGLEVGSSMASAAAYEWAVPFQKDLVLFSASNQSVVPSGNTPVGPATAVVLPTSAYDADMTSSPMIVGRTLMYCVPQSESFFGVVEMVPSNYTDSQYASQEATPHLPKYMGGRCRFACTSSVSNVALFAPSGDPNTLIVHEYFWNGDEKVQSSWHQWTFSYPVEYAYFSGEKIVLMFVKNGTAVQMTIDPRAGAIDASGNLRPFLDGGATASIVDHEVTIPAWMLAFDPAIASKLTLVSLSGALSGEIVGASPNEAGTKLITVLSHPSGTVGIGIPYYSGFIPTPPTVRDYKDQVIHSGKATLQRFLLKTRNSSEFTVNVSDTYSTGEDLAMPTLTFTSPELALDRALFSEEAENIVPCHTELRSTSMEVYTEATGELNLTSLEYTAKYHPKIKRR